MIYFSVFIKMYLYIITVYLIYVMCCVFGFKKSRVRLGYPPLYTHGCGASKMLGLTDITYGKLNKGEHQ